MAAILDAKEHGKIAKGMLEVIRSIQQRKARLVVAATDIQEPLLFQEIKTLCNRFDVALVAASTQHTLGKIIGIKKTAFISVVQPGFDKESFIKLLAQFSESDIIANMVIDQKVNREDCFLSGFHVPSCLHEISRVEWVRERDGWKTKYHFVAKA